MQHDYRRLIALDGLWDFAFVGRPDLSDFDPTSVEVKQRMLVPAAFDAMPELAGKRGTAVYRKMLRIPAGQPALLRFGAVSMWTQIWVDGRCLREHANGYAPFCVELPSAELEVRELIIVVDNRYDHERVPMHAEFFDFYQYGGILRPVVLELLPAEGAWFEHIFACPLGPPESGRIRLELRFGGAAPAIESLRFQIDGRELACPREVEVESNGRFLYFEVVVPEPRVWSPDTPELHTLSCQLLDGSSTVCDDAVVRFGLRQVEARDGQIWLNGKPLELRGYNRHEWHPNFGPATPVQQMVVDLQLLKDMGCNFVRGSHYPQDQRFLDLCDELGMLVWEENLGWGQAEDAFTSEKFARDHADTLQAMVRASCNHPSILFWGMLNEAHSYEDYCAPVFEEGVRLLREMDSSRLITYASNRREKDKFYHLFDVLSLNLYPGWYECVDVEDPVSLIAPCFEEVIAAIDALGHSEKPVIISEIGAEALPGWWEPHEDFFSEAYQARYLKGACEAAFAHPRISGIALWHFSDARTYGGGRSLWRPRSYNNKGSFDEYRRPKQAVRELKELFGKRSAS